MNTASINQESRHDEGFVLIDGVEMYRIPHFDEMPPFLMSITSDTNLWMYLSSTGGLTAGRVDENSPLFPYETEDRLHRLRGVTGPISLLRITHEARPAILWEPFDTSTLDARIERNIYKTALSNRVLFEEIHKSLGLTFQYSWAGCDEHGFVRTARLINNASRVLQVDLLDGLLNLLPSGAKLSLTQTSSCLLDAYKRAEIDAASGAGVYSLTSIVSDRAEPSESLRATAVWSRGLKNATLLLSEDAVKQFRSSRPLTANKVLTGQRGAFLLQSTVELAPGESIEWDIVADVELDHSRLTSMCDWLSKSQHPREEVKRHLDNSAAGLRKIIATCDGLQLSSDHAATAHHASNVLFNTMRGGLPINQYRIAVDDFLHFVKDRNTSIYLANEATLNGWDSELQLDELIVKAERSGIADLVRLAYEYLPLTFARRHGDPSRPWNRFAIHLKNPDGSRRIGYQGNWRDIFQNWEAMAFSFPSLIESFIAKFVNASTIDGFNPYRISQDGIEWEEHNPEDPWSNIGYWGDHQIIYLCKLLEASAQFHPGVLQRLLARPIFSYANVPYRLKPYSLITQDPRNTLDFDRALAKEIENRGRSLGADGKLLLDADGKVYHATLLEKLLVPLLSKLSNLVVDGGIWMNTQRPEWNDANNALAGIGVSVVTLCYLRRYTEFLLSLLSAMSSQNVRVSAEVLDWCEKLTRILATSAHGESSPRKRRELLDAFGAAFDVYRHGVYANGFTGKVSASVRAFVESLRLALQWIDESLKANQREDQLFNGYNVLTLSSPQTADMRALPTMLEGQVAALSSGLLSSEQAASLLESLFGSSLWREDQQSFMLYPQRELPGFFERNLLPREAVENNPLLQELLRHHEQSVISKDSRGGYRFNGSFHHVRDLEAALTRLGRQNRWQSLVVSHRKSVLDVFETVFKHQSFTGRSGAMYAYEGIGCVYWHMVTKLLLAVQENYWNAVDSNAPEAASLAQYYYRVRSGLGFNKRAAEYGAVPLDPYSHTPAVGGARQPGMTGQVKEEILTRLGEWGLRIRAGEVHFEPKLLRASELMTASSIFEYIDLDGRSQQIELPESSAAFTFCQTPIVYVAGDVEFGVSVHSRNGVVTHSHVLCKADSTKLFTRNGEIQQVRVSIPISMLLHE